MSTTTLPRRAPRRARPVDLELFTPTVDAALAAFRQDVSYAVAMARSAVVIARKRDDRLDRGGPTTGSYGRDAA